MTSSLTAEVSRSRPSRFELPALALLRLIIACKAQLVGTGFVAGSHKLNKLPALACQVT